MKGEGNSGHGNGGAGNKGETEGGTGEHGGQGSKRTWGYGYMGNGNISCRKGSPCKLHIVDILYRVRSSLNLFVSFFSQS